MWGGRREGGAEVKDIFLIVFVMEGEGNDNGGNDRDFLKLLSRNLDGF